MVGLWGMSPAVGPIAILPEDGRGPFLPGVSETSEHTQRLLDEEVHRLVEDAHADVTALLTAHRAQLEGLAHALLAGETLDAPDAYAAAGLPQPEREEDSPNGSVPAAQRAAGGVRISRPGRPARRPAAGRPARTPASRRRRCTRAG